MLEHIGVVLSIILAAVSLVTTCVMAGIYIGKLEGFKEFINYRFDEQNRKLEKHNNFSTGLRDVERYIDGDEQKIEHIINRFGT